MVVSFKYVVNTGRLKKKSRTACSGVKSDVHEWQSFRVSKMEKTSVGGEGQVRTGGETYVTEKVKECLTFF